MNRSGGGSSAQWASQSASARRISAGGGWGGGAGPAGRGAPVRGRFAFGPVGPKVGESSGGEPVGFGAQDLGGGGVGEGVGPRGAGVADAQPFGFGPVGPERGELLGVVAHALRGFCAASVGGTVSVTACVFPFGGRGSWVL